MSCLFQPAHDKLYAISRSFVYVVCPVYFNLEVQSMKLFLLSLLVVFFVVDCAFAVTFTSEDGGFSIDLPEGWQPLSPEQMKTMGSRTSLFARDPEAAQQGKTLSVTGLKASVSDKVTVVSVVDQIRAQSGVKGDVKSEVKSFGGFDWTKLTYAMEVRGETLGIAQYIAISDNFLYTFSFTANDLGVYDAIFDRVMESFR
jgi:hypothetical protein